MLASAANAREKTANRKRPDALKPSPGAEPRCLSGSNKNTCAGCFHRLGAAAGKHEDVIGNKAWLTARRLRAVLDFLASPSEISTLRQLSGRRFKQDEQEDKAALDRNTRNKKRKIKALTQQKPDRLLHRWVRRSPA